ncbi:MarR family transcriptional regulator [Herbihabitans rhizosphaerae]|uniref:MarR family transcriptional regulator n=1 Tax=Herbihabitans rhizosphaerae TaxID=1872711 RepID=A0A4Q7KDJ3_9PSEU|nr:MarR family winged helix-turn-helix transcriptional regulator [Herbihabitans rhizosphaerae]RZS32275.1 MarR family transcriptional regulator [Herbihabitans rhizosphaerae]
MTEEPWLDETEQQAWRSFLSMKTRLTRYLVRQLQEDSGLSGQDYEILVCLSEAPERRMRAVDLGEETQWEKSRLSHQVSRMEQRGLVCRERVPGLRFPEVVLTEQGFEAIAKAAPAHAAAVRTVFIDALGERRLSQFAKACTAILDRLDEVEEEDEADSC